MLGDLQSTGSPSSAGIVIRKFLSAEGVKS
jgi:hypothetical protein